MFCRLDLEVKNFGFLKTKFEASKNALGMYCSLVLYMEFGIISP